MIFDGKSKEIRSEHVRNRTGFVENRKKSLRNVSKNGETKIYD